MGKHKLDFNNLSKKDQGKIVKGSVIPRPIAWITSLNDNGSTNLAPFSYFTVLSSSLLAVSFQKTANSKKDTFVNIMREKEAVIHIVDKSLLEQMDLSAKPLDRNVSEVDLTNLKLEPSLKVKTPGLSEALIRLEVTLVSSIPLMDFNNQEEDADLVILRVIGAILNDKVYDSKNNYILVDKLQPVARLAGVDYGEILSIDYKRKF